MSRILMIIAWAAFAVGFLFAVHYYIWARLLRDPGWPANWQHIGAYALLLLALSMPAAMIVSRLTQSEAAKPLVWTAFIWMGLMFLLLVLLGTVDIARLVGSGVSRLARAGVGPVDPGRRLFFARLLGGGVAFTALAAGGVGMVSALGRPRLRRVRVKLPRLPASLSGFRLVQISDMHVGPTIGRELVADIVRRTNALEPDLVAITGDLVDGSVAELAEIVAPLTELRSRYGTFFITGNHEYYSGATAWCEHLKTLGIRVLHNERVSIGDGDASFDLAGVDDPTARRFNLGPGDDVAAAVVGRDPERELVLLAHQPKTIFRAAKNGVGLQLSGHTHGGQIFPFTLFVRLVQPYVAGLARHNSLTQIYVSRGTGYWGPPMRLGAPSELTAIELQRA